jgi:hypothetical protein
MPIQQEVPARVDIVAVAVHHDPRQRYNGNGNLYQVTSTTLPCTAALLVTHVQCRCAAETHKLVVCFESIHCSADSQQKASSID